MENYNIGSNYLKYLLKSIIALVRKIVDLDFKHYNPSVAASRNERGVFI